MTKLFLSHASEDKDDFVRPLAEALRASSYEVWYDEFVLTMGDSLFAKINDGLATCDYGIVVLSKHFFSKKWPQAELNGLFTLEELNGKVILPIWKEISQAEVRQYSPILADRIAAKSDSGIKEVVSKIEYAIATSNRASHLSERQSPLQRFKDLDRRLTASNAARQKLLVDGAIDEIAKAGTDLLGVFLRSLTALNQQSSTLKLKLKTGVDKTFSGRELRKYVLAEGPFYLCVRFEYDEEVTCAAERTRLRLKVWQSIPQPMWEHPVGPKEPRIIFLRKEDFAPKFDADLKLCWQLNNKIFTSEELADHALTAFVDELEANSAKAA